MSPKPHRAAPGRPARCYRCAAGLVRAGPGTV